MRLRFAAILGALVLGLARGREDGRADREADAGEGGPMGSCIKKQKYLSSEGLVSGNPQDVQVTLPGREVVMSKRFQREIVHGDGAKAVNLDEVLRVDILQERIALVTLLCQDANETFPWGTRICEHRINPVLVGAINKALDLALESPEVCAVVVTGEGKFFSNGMDLKWLDANPREADALQLDAEKLMARLLCFPMPTIAAINGHFCAAGAMLGLTFDFRVMNAERGLFFVPGIDLGLVYSPGMTALLKAKTPVHYHNDMIVFGNKYTAKDLERDHVVHSTCHANDVVPMAVEHAVRLTDKHRFQGPKYRETMAKIKQNTYAEAFNALRDESNFQGMGFDEGSWDEHGKSKL